MYFIDCIQDLSLFKVGIEFPSRPTLLGYSWWPNEKK